MLVAVKSTNRDRADGFPGRAQGPAPAAERLPGGSRVGGTASGRPGACWAARSYLVLRCRPRGGNSDRGRKDQAGSSIFRTKSKAAQQRGAAVGRFPSGGAVPFSVEPGSRGRRGSFGARGVDVIQPTIQAKFHSCVSKSTVKQGRFWIPQARKVTGAGATKGPPKLVLFSEHATPVAAAPPARRTARFYLSADGPGCNVTWDLNFFRELQGPAVPRAAGRRDSPRAYVMSRHEYGHHVPRFSWVMKAAHAVPCRQGSAPTSGGPLSVRLERQAD